MQHLLKSNLFKATIILGIVFSLISCGQTVRFVTSTVVPAAEGKVKIKKDDNNNYGIEIEIKNLAEPNKLTPARKTYVVWMNDSNNQSKNLGQLTTSSGLFSSTLKASFKTVSPIKPTRIFITAEDSGTPVTPGSQVVLNTDSF
jgi:hypothetical protein